MADINLPTQIGQASIDEAVKNKNSDPLFNDGYIYAGSQPKQSSVLPYTKIEDTRAPIAVRHIISWFIPTVGSVKMYCNPGSIQYKESKIIPEATLTKGGYSVSLWGEKLISLSISGNTGASGIEGINVLREIYRAEQYVFDNLGLLLSQNTTNFSQNIANQSSNFLGSSLDQLIPGMNSGVGAAGISDLVGASLGVQNVNALMNYDNIPTLADIAFGIEMYYSGETYRGYFTSFDVTETANEFIFKYQMNFTCTQKRGYRLNFLPFQKSPYYGASSDYTPYSYDKRLAR